MREWISTAPRRSAAARNCRRWSRRLTPDMTRRPPRRAPCLARHQQVTMRAAFQLCWPRPSLGRNSPSEMGDRRVGTGDAVRGDRSVVVDFAPAMNALVSNVLNANSTSTTRAFPWFSCTWFRYGWKGFPTRNNCPPGVSGPRICPRLRPESGNRRLVHRPIQPDWELSTDFSATGAKSRPSAHCRHGPIPGEAAHRWSSPQPTPSCSIMSSR